MCQLFLDNPVLNIVVFIYLRLFFFFNLTDVVITPPEQFVVVSRTQVDRKKQLGRMGFGPVSVDPYVNLLVITPILS